MGGKLILITGRCATGKSTFARRLAAEVSVPCFLKDEVKEVLGEGLGPEGGLVYQKGSQATFRLLAYLAEGILAAGQCCILEGNFKPEELKELQALLEKYDARCLTCCFTGDLETLYRRYRTREEERHWVHRSMDRGLEAFAAGQSRLPLAGPGENVLVDGTDVEQLDETGLFAAAKAFLASSEK